MSNYGKTILEATVEEVERISALAVKAAQKGELEEMLIQVGRMTAVLEKGRDILGRTSLSDGDFESLRNTVWLEATTRKRIMEALMRLAETEA